METSNKNRNYYVSFIAGIIVFIIGLIVKQVLIWVIGIAFMVYGFMNRDKWPKRLAEDNSEEAPAEKADDAKETATPEEPAE